MDLPQILIVEDDLIIAAHISTVIKTHGYNVVESLTKGESVLDFIKHNSVDVLLMDIQLGGDLDGIETAELVQETHRTPIIFLTANGDQPTFDRAKKTFPYAFMSKPFKEEELLRTLELVINQKATSTRPGEYTNNKSLSDRIFVRDKKKMVKLKIEDILYVEAERNYCKITTRSKPYTLSVPLMKFEKKVSSDIFMRIHRSHLVNISAIDELDDHYVYINGKALSISKSYKHDLNKRLTMV
jgi:DNA-binding LytR/AlgR family response regulator